MGDDCGNVSLCNLLGAVRELAEADLSSRASSVLFSAKDRAGWTKYIKCRLSRLGVCFVDHGAKKRRSTTWAQLALCV